MKILSSWSFSEIASTISTSSTGQPTTRWVWVSLACSQQLALDPIGPIDPGPLKCCDEKNCRLQVASTQCSRKTGLSSKVNPGWSQTQTISLRGIVATNSDKSIFKIDPSIDELGDCRVVKYQFQILGIIQLFVLHFLGQCLMCLCSRYTETDWGVFLRHC